jgi:hypothetical protein
MKIRGSCHCGNIRLAIEWPDEAPDIPARACDCTFCTKHGGVWTSHPRASLTGVIADTSMLSEYAFGTRTAIFHVCTRCGAAPFVTSEIDGRLYAVVNVNVLDDVDASRIRRSPTHFEGEDTTSRLARRERNWIANVRIDRGANA